MKEIGFKKFRALKACFVLDRLLNRAYWCV